MRFENQEIKDLVSSGFILSLAFAILFAGGIKGILNLSESFSLLLGISFITAGSGFLLHEIMHKYVAQRYKLNAEFRASYPMLWMALISSLFGFLIAAPGAVMIKDAMNRERLGKIAVAGPATNIVLSVFFLMLSLFFDKGLLYIVFLQGFSINSLLALFNMIPVVPFDGSKILNWSRNIYLICLSMSTILFILQFII